MENKEMNNQTPETDVKEKVKLIDRVKQIPWKKVGKVAGIAAGVLLGGAVVGKFTKPNYDPLPEDPFEEDDEDK